MKYQCTQEKFLEAVDGHVMTICHDSGIYRDIKYGRPGTSIEGFKLITWPWHLCICGDMGTYVFCRTEDMFEFFRNDSLKINPGYWHEKMVSNSRFEGVQKFSHEIFEDIVKSEFRSACLDGDIDITKRRDVWQDIEASVLSAENEHDAFDYASGFRSNGFEFFDFWEHSLKEYTYQFIWCLRAIVWGIHKYDKAYRPNPS